MGLRRKLMSFNAFYEKIHLACPQETKLSKRMKFMSCTILRKDREDGAGGGFSMLIKTSEIKFKEITFDEGGQLFRSITDAEIYLPEHSLHH
ncbi:hypothetical protein CEXT_148641 [Caerostris extrusa]|uniref:Uncharacterized protein n=1 Tax=Caerostris extrusa TaxID=172846 RepID=A0AAV4V0J6_CAEEX|nr:hypothetical protein CEXT_148641 [Caerostris extrusa]